METEDIHEQTTPMITDDVDSDVSMATAQSGSAVPTDEDMSTPSPATTASDSKKSDVVKLAEAFSKVEQKRDPLPDVVLSKTSSSKELIANKYELNPMTIEDLRLLTECFYLPYEHGSVGRTVVQKFKWLRENALELSRSSDKKSEAYIDKVGERSFYLDRIFSRYIMVKTNTMSFTY